MRDVGRGRLRPGGVTRCPVIRRRLPAGLPLTGVLVLSAVTIAVHRRRGARPCGRLGLLHDAAARAGLSPVHRLLRPSGTIGQRARRRRPRDDDGPGRLRGPEEVVAGCRALGSMKRWLDVHIFCGIVGPVLVTFHSALKFNGVISVAYWSMMAVMLSGFVGRYLYVRMPRSIRGAELSYEEIVAQAAAHAALEVAGGRRAPSETLERGRAARLAAGPVANRARRAPALVDEGSDPDRAAAAWSTSRPNARCCFAGSAPPADAAALRHVARLPPAARLRHVRDRLVHIGWRSTSATPPSCSDDGLMQRTAPRRTPPGARRAGSRPRLARRRRAPPGAGGRARLAGTAVEGALAARGPRQLPEVPRAGTAGRPREVPGVPQADRRAHRGEEGASTGT